MKMPKVVVVLLASFLLGLFAFGQGRAGQLDLRVDVSSLGPACENYHADEPFYGEFQSGNWPDVSWVPGQYQGIWHACFTNCAVYEDPVDRLECYYDGDLIVAWTGGVPKSTFWYEIAGWRKMAARVRVEHDGEITQYLSYMGSLNGDWEGISDIARGDSVRIDAMICPDVNGDGFVDLFNDLFTTAFDFGCAGKPWLPSECVGNATDHNEDLTVDLFNDIFEVANRVYLECGNWLYGFQ